MYFLDAQLRIEFYRTEIRRLRERLGYLKTKNLKLKYHLEQRISTQTEESSGNTVRDDKSSDLEFLSFAPNFEAVALESPVFATNEVDISPSTSELPPTYDPLIFEDVTPLTEAEVTITSSPNNDIPALILQSEPLPCIVSNILGECTEDGCSNSHTSL